jgi:hypothetical protein
MSKLHKFLVGCSVPAGLKLLLTDEQAAARAHILTALDPESKAKRKPYGVDAPAYFKAGEEIGIEGNVGRELQAALGVPDADKATKKGHVSEPTHANLKKAFDEGKAAGKAEVAADMAAKLEDARKEARKEGRAELLAEIEGRNALVDALEAALAAQEGLASDANDDAKAAAQKAVDDAQAAVDALKPLEA